MLNTTGPGSFNVELGAPPPNSQSYDSGKSPSGSLPLPANCTLPPGSIFTSVAGSSMWLSGVVILMVTLSNTLPGVHRMSFTFDPASPGGPHTASTLIELGPNDSLTGPWW